MNDITLFLSQLIGPVLFLLGLSWALHEKSWKTFVDGLGKDNSLLLYNGIIETTAGLAIVLHHNIWSGLAAFLITLLGWLMIIEGALDLFVSRSTFKHWAKSMSAHMVKVWGVVMAAIGGYLVWIGYLA